jgi:hypothetical protein
LLAALLPSLSHSHRDAERLSLLAAAAADEFEQARLDVALGVVGLVRDPLDEIVDVAGEVEIRGG